MRMKTLLIGVIAGLFSLSLMSCSDHDHGHSHGSVEQHEAQQPVSSPDSIAHDNIDSQ